MSIPQKESYASYWKVRQACAWWESDTQNPIRVSGKDAASYLQSQITQDILPLEVGQGTAAALVDRKAHIQSLFTVHRKDVNEYLLVPTCGSEKLYDHLEAFHFVEDVSITREQNLVGLRVEGPQCFKIFQTLSGINLNQAQAFDIRSAAVSGGSATLIVDNISGESGVLLLMPDSLKNAFIQVLTQQMQIERLEPLSYEALRLEAGYAVFGQDMTEDTQLPATGQESFRVSYNKGCYLGQEVIARIHTYGVVPYKLMGGMSDEPIPEGEFKINAKKQGEITSSGWSPTYEQYISLGYVHKNVRHPGESYTLQFETGTYAVEIRRLPFYTPPTQSEQARLMYEQALDVFAEDQEQNAVQLLYSAIEKYSHLADAYESLGVILSRMGQHEEAIRIMKQLTEIDPEEPMAHTNLSRFYMLIGDKQTAEDHMAEATRLDMQKRSTVMQQEALKVQERAQKENMISMFKEVLETEDSEDLVANFGLGKALVDLERFEEAESYLQKAVEIDAYYSAAYLQLGKALTENGKPEDARQIYEQGIKAAAEKGDLMPMKEMEQRLMGLNS